MFWESIAAVGCLCEGVLSEVKFGCSGYVFYTCCALHVVNVQLIL